MKMTLLMAVLACICVSVHADQVDMTSGTALAENQLKNRQQLIRMAFINLLSKYTGMSAADLSQKQVLDDAALNRHVFRFYQEAVPGSDQSRVWHHITVDPAYVESLAERYFLPLWPLEREPVMIIMVEESVNSGEGLVFSEADSMAMYWLEKWLQALGVPHRFLLHSDIREHLEYAPDKIKNLALDAVDYVRENDLSSHVLMVYVQNQGSGYSYRMGLSSHDQAMQINHRQFIQLSDGLQFLAQQVQSALASNNQIFANEIEEHTIPVRVSEINGYDDLSRLLNYLSRHSLIETQEIQSYSDHSVDLTLTIDVIPDAFLRFMSNEHVLDYQPLLGRGRYLFKMIHE